jgi:hypothetical protein
VHKNVKSQADAKNGVGALDISLALRTSRNVLAHFRGRTVCLGGAHSISFLIRAR